MDGTYVSIILVGRRNIRDVPRIDVVDQGG